MNNENDFKKYLPKHHLDNYYIEELKALSDKEIEPLLKDLLIWVKNMHQGVSKEVVSVLVLRANLLSEILIELLDNEKTDTILKYNIIAYLINDFSNENKKIYLKTLNRIINKPTKYELYSEVNIIAKKVVEEINK